MNQKNTVRVRVQKMGAFLSAEVMPNIGVFIGWGILAALFIPTGWTPNETMNGMVAPTMKYLMPILIAYTGGYNVHKQRGGVIGAFATMGLVLGASINMLAGAMLMGPLAAWCLKKFDKAVQGKIKPGLEMIVNNFSLGLIGLALMVIGFFGVVPLIEALIAILSGGVNFLLERGLLPLLSILVQPGKVLFLNNAINHGIMIPIGVEQAEQMGKSLMFMIEANNGCVFGVAMAFAIFGRGVAKKAAPGAAFINFFGGIGEVVYPFVLSKPKVILGQIAGSAVSLFIIQNFNGGTVAPISPGSFFALMAVSPKSSIVVNIVSYLAGALVSCIVAGIILKYDRTPDEALMLDGMAAGISSGSGAVTASAVKPAIVCAVNRIVFACDAGMGSSVMAESIMRTKLNKAMLDVEVLHIAVGKAGETVQPGDIVITSAPLEARVRSELEGAGIDVPVHPVANLLDGERYDQIISEITKAD